MDCSAQSKRYFQFVHRHGLAAHSMDYLLCSLRKLCMDLNLVHDKFLRIDWNSYIAIELH